MHYFEVAVANVRNRNTIISAEYLKNYLQRAQVDNQELYRSYYMFDKEMLDHMELYKTVKSFKGTFYMYRLLLDIDKGKDSDEEVQRRAKEFIISLEQDWNIDLTSIRIWFSGTGYHIEIPNIFKLSKAKELPEIWKDTAAKHFPESDIKPLIRTGLIRVGYTINLKTNLYKIPLTKQELFTLKWQDIHKLAESFTDRDIEIGDLQSDLDFSDKIVKNIVPVVKVKNEQEIGTNVSCMMKLWNRGPEKGRRHHDILRLVSSFRRKDIPRDGIAAMMVEWANTMDKKEVVKMVNNTFDSDYKFSCKDHIMQEFCDPKCIFFTKKNYGDNFKSMDIVEQAYVEFIRSDFSKTSFDLATVFPGMDSFKCYPGEFIVLLGNTKLGKTALVQNLVAKLKMFNILFYNLETSTNLMYRRQIQIEYGYSKEQVKIYYEQNTNTLSNKVQHIQYNQLRPTLDEMRKNIIEYQPKLVIVDTLAKVRPGTLGEHKNREEKLAFEFSEFAKQYNTIMFAVHHISKDAASLDNKGNKKELGIHSGKGDSAVEQEADKVLIFDGNVDGNKRRLRSAGARDEAPFDIELFYNKNNFRMFKI